MKESNCFIFLGLICVLSFNIAAHAQDSSKTSPGTPDQVIADLISDNETKSRNAALQIRNTADLNWLPRLAPLLESPQGRSRQIVTMLVLGIYPDKAFDFFSKASRSETVFAREAAMYGLARIPAITVIDPLFKGTTDTDETVRNAALRGLQLICRPNGAQLFTALQTRDESPLASRHPAESKLQDQLSGLDFSRHSLQWKAVWQDLASRKTILAIQSRYLKSIEDQSLATALENVFASNNTWAAKPVLQTDLNYAFSMVNLVAGSSKEITIAATPDEIDRTRFLGYDLERAVQTRLVIDLWLQAPHLYTRTVQISNGKLLVDIDLEDSPGLFAGIGLLNISYWQSRVSSGKTGTILFDANTGAWLAEEVKDSNGRVVWKAESTFADNSPEFKPAVILIQMPEGQVGAKRYDLKFKAEFAKTAGVYHLVRATMHENTSDESGDSPPQLRALAELTLSTDNPVED